MTEVRNDHLGLFRGRFAFHLHTVQTDGRLTVQEYFDFAAEHAIERLIILEHIRKEPTYDVDAFIASIRRGAEQTGIATSIGFEAKVLPGGALDIDDRHVEQAEVIGIAEHGFPDDAQLLIGSLNAAFERYGAYAGSKNVVWVHPGLKLKRLRLLDDMVDAYRALIERAWEAGLAVEHNLRYDLVPKGLLPPPAENDLITGIDAHVHRDLERAFSGPETLAQ